MIDELRIYAAIIADEISKDFDCATCHESAKRKRHCPFIPKEEWQGNIKYIINTADGQRVIDECPLGYLLQRDYFRYYFDCYYAAERGLPLFANIGFMELPNLLVEAILTIASEFNRNIKSKKDELALSHRRASTIPTRK